jgi:hypothetical protein
VVKDVAGVVGDAANVVGAVAGEDVVDADWIYASSVVVTVKPPTPVVQVIWSMMNMRPSAMAVKSGMMTIWNA